MSTGTASMNCQSSQPLRTSAHVRRQQSRQGHRLSGVPFKVRQSCTLPGSCNLLASDVIFSILMHRQWTCSRSFRRGGRMRHALARELCERAVGRKAFGHGACRRRGAGARGARRARFGAGRRRAGFGHHSRLHAGGVSGAGVVGALEGFLGSKRSIWRGGGGQGSQALERDDRSASSAWVGKASRRRPLRVVASAALGRGTVDTIVQRLRRQRRAGYPRSSTCREAESEP